MKNVLLRSAQIFVSMSILNFLLCIVTLSVLNLPGGTFGMFPFLILAECCITTVIAFITVLFFKRNYDSVGKIAVLFEIIYLTSLIISGFYPFGRDDDSLVSLLMYLNSGIVLFLIYFGNQIISSKRKS